MKLIRLSLALLIGSAVIIAIVEGKVYETGTAIYLVAGLIEIGIFLIGILAGYEIARYKDNRKV